MEWSAHCNTEDIRWVLRERSLILDGADPRAFACEIPASVLQRRMRPQIENFLDDLLTWASFEISWTQRYAVEASSRMLYTLEHGEVVSKQVALDWATRDLPAEWLETGRSSPRRPVSFSGTIRRDPDLSSAAWRSSSTYRNAPGQATAAHSRDRAPDALPSPRRSYVSRA